MPIIAGRASAAYGAGFAAVTTPPYLGPFGSFDSLSTVTVGSTSVSSVTLNGIPTGYRHLQVRYMVKSARTGGNPLDELNMRMNGDSGSNYVQRAYFGDGSSTSANAIASSNNIEIGSGWIGDAEATSQFGVGIIDLFDYDSSSKNKTIRVFGGIDFNGAPVYGGRVGTASGLWLNTSPITSLTFYAENGNITQYSQFALYGVK